MNKEMIQKLVIAALGIILLAIIFFLLVPTLTRGKGNITIDTVPGDTSIVFDGNTYKSPAKLKDIPGGKHNIEISKKGYKTRVEEILVEKNKNTELTLRLYTSDSSPTAVRVNLDEASKLKSDLEKLTAFLPFANEKFKVEFKTIARKPSIEINLYARLNKASQLDRFRSEIKEFSAAALDWIRSKDVDPENLNIIWEPVDPKRF